MNPHLTNDEIAGLVLGDSTPDAQAHLAACGHCRGEVHQLENAFLNFRDSAERWGEHWYKAGTVPRLTPIWSWRRLAAAGGLVSTALLILLARGPARPRPTEEPFLPIPYVAPLAPYEQASVMRMEVPVAALTAAGFEVHASDAGDAITVDVLVGQDGRAHAIRPIR
jgi:hypothetical protein